MEAVEVGAIVVALIVVFYIAYYFAEENDNG